MTTLAEYEISKFKNEFNDFTINNVSLSDGSKFMKVEMGNYIKLDDGTFVSRLKKIDLHLYGVYGNDKGNVCLDLELIEN